MYSSMFSFTTRTTSSYQTPQDFASNSLILRRSTKKRAERLLSKSDAVSGLLESRKHDPIRPGNGPRTLRRCHAVRATAGAQTRRDSSRLLSDVHVGRQMEARRSGVD